MQKYAKILVPSGRFMTYVIEGVGLKCGFGPKKADVVEKN